MRSIGIDMQTVFGLPPVDHVRLAAELGCGHISIGPGPMPWNPCGFAPWSLADDPALRRDVVRAIADTGVRIVLAEGYVVRPQVEARDRVADLDVLVELGAERINTVVMEPDLARARDQLAMLADLAAERGLGFVMEFAPPHPVGNLAEALAMLRAIDKPGARLVIDTMHLFRSGGTAADLAALDPDLIGYVQFCDVPREPIADTYLAEACFNRRIPGEGDAPLRDILRVLPANVPLGLEIPMQSRIEAGESLRAIVGEAVAATRNMLAELGEV